MACGSAAFSSTQRTVLDHGIIESRNRSEGDSRIKAAKAVAAYRRLRAQPQWRLLAAEHAPIIIGLLQVHLSEGERSVPGSLFHERIERELEELRGQGLDLAQSAQAYIAEWLRSGFLERRFPAGAAEEEYELSAAAANAIRYISALLEPRSTATESRLAVVIDRLVRLAEETDLNPQSRVARLMAERERLDAEIAAARAGRLTALTDSQALERARDIIQLAEELAGDFRRVRERFEELNRDLRERLIDEEGGNRGAVLHALFAGVDLIGDSDAGRTFTAFWRLLTDPEQSTTLEESLEQVLARAFAHQLLPRERRFLRLLVRMLLDQGGSVHDVLQHFARSLKHFVQSREYLEQRRLSQVLKDAQRAALEIKDHVPATASSGYTLQLTSSRVRSIAQWELFDPSLHTPTSGMTEGAGAPIGLDAVGDLLAQSEIDFRALKANLCDVLHDRSPASISDVLHRYPAAQGLGSVVGYIALGSRHGMQTGRHEKVTWRGNDGERRSAKIPMIYFVKERLHELR